MEILISQAFLLQVDSPEDAMSVKIAFDAASEADIEQRFARYAKEHNLSREEIDEKAKYLGSTLLVVYE